MAAICVAPPALLDNLDRDLGEAVMTATNIDQRLRRYVAGMIDLCGDW